MCGRFSIAGFEGFEERFQLEIEFPDLKPNYNVTPSQGYPDDT
jgi:putative SOS response-associated peptidase YedK